MTKMCPQCGSIVRVQIKYSNTDVYKYYFSCCKEHFWVIQETHGWWKEVDGNLVPIEPH
jgi:rRNA maturation protein Nop10